MDFLTAWQSSLSQVWSRLVTLASEHLFQLLGAVLLLVAGWMAARLLRMLTRKFGQLLDTLLQHVYQRRGLEPPRQGFSSGRMLGELVFWVTFLFFVSAAMHVLGVQAFTQWMQRVLAYLPTLMVGAIIVLAGVLASTLTRDIVLATAPVAMAQRTLLARIAQFSVLVTAVVIGADQVGINVTLIIVMAAIVAAALLGGLALALSLGARGYVANLIGMRVLRENYRLGQTIRIGEHTGRLIEFTPVAAILDTSLGRLTLPGRLFSEESILLLPDEADHGAP